MISKEQIATIRRLYYAEQRRITLESVEAGMLLASVRRLFRCVAAEHDQKEWVTSSGIPANFNCNHSE